MLRSKKFQGYITGLRKASLGVMKVQHRNPDLEEEAQRTWGGREAQCSTFLGGTDDGTLIVRSLYR